MFNKDYELVPRTYSIKSYKRRETFGLKKIIKYIFYTVLLVGALGVTVLSLANLV